MLRRDRIFYRKLLRQIPLGELVTLYEQTLPECEVLARIIAAELDRRLGGGVTAAVRRAEILD